MAWCDETRGWWRMWQESPLAPSFATTDWAFLAETAVLHHILWSTGDISVMGELRIRVAKFGATPEDRARLRIQFAQADQAEAGGESSRAPGGSRARRRDTRAV